MNTPVPALMKQFGTEAVFQEKTAGAEPLLARLGMSILNYELAKGMQRDDQKQGLENALRAEAAREYELARMAPATDNLRHTRVPLFVPAGSDLPVGYDEGMVRLASIAVGAGADMAKEGGFGDMAAFAKSMASKVTPALQGMGQKVVGALKPGWKTHAALAAGTAATVYGGVKAMGALGNAMSSEQAPATYGGSVRGMGYQLPATVNQYGQPTVGAPIA